MSIYWLRPAFKRYSLRSPSWASFNKALCSSYSLLPFFVFFLLIVAVLVFTGQVDLGNYVSYSYIRSSRESSIDGLNCAAWNYTKSCPRYYPVRRQPSANPPPTCPDYFRWIHEDLRHWRQTGVTKEMVEKARETAHFHLTILDGKVYVENFRQSIQTRALFTVWGIAQLARTYPGRLPDLELMFDCDDRPVVEAERFGLPDSAPPPLFRYCSDWRSLDIVFPDWSFWGWAETNIKPWRSVLKDIKEGNKKAKWEDREPYAYWKGNPDVCPWRADLMRCNATPQTDWNARLYVQNWIAESQQGYKQSNLGNQCTHRYKIYIEGWAWSVSEKYIFACDSPVLLNTLRWHDFFIRGMVPQHHYWPVRDDDKCRSLKFAVEWGNNRTKMAKSIGEAGSRFIHEDLKMEYVYDYMFHLLNEYGKLMKYKPSVPAGAVELCPESVACAARGIWRKFMEESLEKGPSESDPCTMQPPYNPQEILAFNEGKIKRTKQVEAWENQYWGRQKRKKQRL
ncbi:protein O-glucosyltransferase 1-like isoform X2 [Salvia splendens]|nr:protein O-glucosyltransferase 1-like isoform X2 [Salvia splendens]XP_042049610.1 protein O-glucosyltransferase 1-like isoform X2 [Salvia splendens]